jgi:hypothetical protein
MSKTRNELTLLLCFLLAVVLSLSATPLLAQRGGAKIEGTVADSTGAVLPGVEVTITNVDTAQSRLAITGDLGRYSAPLLATGNYEVRAELAGFQTGVRRGIRLVVGQEAVVDFTLELGSISEEVVVTGEAALVNTTTSTLSDVINEFQVDNLPLNTRNLTQFGLLTPGVVQIRTGVTGGVTLGAPSIRISVAGAKFYSTGFLLDGTDVTDSSRGMGPSGAAGSMFGVETIKEIQVITNNYSSEYGRFAGGLMSMVSKSGSNTFHGSLFFFHRNDNLDASNFFDNKFGEEKPEFRRHQFGATIGGPIIEDKTFFFFSYEGFRQALGQTKIGLVPSVEAKQGLFDAVGGACSSSHLGLGGVYDPALDRCRLPLHPEVGPFLALYPDPSAANVTGPTGDLVHSGSEPTTDDSFTARVDHNFSDSDSFFARFTSSKGDREPVVDGQNSFIPFVLTTLSGLQLYSTMEWKHIVSPSTINTFRFGAQRNEWKEGARNPGPLDIGFFPDRAQGDILPGDGVMHAGLRLEGQNVSNQFSYGDDIFMTRGQHDLKLGVLITRHQTNDFTIGRGGGSFTWNGIDDFVTGNPFEWRGKIPRDNPQRGSRQTVMGFYIQDDFKFRPNFTINLGLRYEPSTSPTEVNGLMANLRDPLNDTVGTCVAVADGFDCETPYFKTPSKNNFAPRIGFAWDPFSDGRTSIRAGFGVFHETILPYHYTGQIRRSPPIAFEPRIRDAASLAAQFPAPPQEALTASGGTLDFQVAEFEPSQPYMMQWNLSLQRELGKDISVTAAYVGSHGVHLGSQRNLNTRIPEILPDGRKLYRTRLSDRNPAWADIDYWDFANNSFYHGLQLAARKRFSDGLQFQMSYTFGRSVDSASSINQSDVQENTSKTPQDAYNVAGTNQGLSDHHVQNHFSFNFSYELPISGLSGASKALLEGWQVNGIISLNTGNPYKLLSGTSGNLRDYDEDGESSTNSPSLRPGANSNPVLNDGRDPDRYYDPNAFILPDPGFYGDLGRNTLIGPGVATTDLSLFKNTDVAEEVTIQFRAEFFNIFNRANFGGPDRTIFNGPQIAPVSCAAYGSTGPTTGCNQLLSAPEDLYRESTVGRITRTRTSSRQIQLGLRLVF